jgi:hypothetical protein
MVSVQEPWMIDWQPASSGAPGSLNFKSQHLITPLQELTLLQFSSLLKQVWCSESLEYGSKGNFTHPSLLRLHPTKRAIKLQAYTLLAQPNTLSLQVCSLRAIASQLSGVRQAHSLVSCELSASAKTHDRWHFHVARPGS